MYSAIESVFLIPIPHLLSSFHCLSMMASSVSIPSLVSNFSFSATLACWGQNSPHEPQLMPLRYIDCKQAILNIPMGEKALAPLSFSRDPDAGFTVPYIWDYGSCAIGIDLLRNDDREISTFAAIFKRAFDIAVECVIKSPHLGGRGFVGENGRLMVSIRGADSDASSLGLVVSNRNLSVDAS